MSDFVIEKAKETRKTVTVFYADRPYELEKERYTTEELKTIFAVEPGYVLDVVAQNGDFVELKPGEEIKVKKELRFVSHAPCGQSS